MKRFVIIGLLCVVPLPVFALTPDEFAFAGRGAVPAGGRFQ